MPLLTLIPDLMQAFFCFYEVFFRRKPILEILVASQPDRVGQTFTALGVILRNPLPKPVYLQDLTLHFKRRRIAFRHPDIWALSLNHPDIHSILIQSNPRIQNFLHGKEPLSPGRAIYVYLALPSILPRQLTEEPAVVITAVARLQEGSTITAVLKRAVSFSNWEGRDRRPTNRRVSRIW